MDKKSLDHLLQRADKVRENAYAPYSNFKVGSAILLKDGSVITGVNIENAAYGVVLCAERAAMARVVTEGQQNNVVALAVVTSATPPGSPCGMCRQFLSEFLLDNVPIVFGNDRGESVVTDMAELLPFAFNKAALK